MRACRRGLIAVCSRLARVCRCAVMRGSLQSNIALMVQCCAMLGQGGLCGASRAFTMGKPCFHGLLLVRARVNEPRFGCSEACGVFWCFCWCCVPLWAHSTATCTFACTRWPGCCQYVLPQAPAREGAASASRGGLASERVLGEVVQGAHHGALAGDFFA